MSPFNCSQKLSPNLALNQASRMVQNNAMKDTDHSGNGDPEGPEAPFDAELTGKPDHELDELRGCVELGMAKEALRLARGVLRREPLSAGAFANAVMAN